MFTIKELYFLIIGGFMERITVSFHDELYKTLEKNSEQKKIALAKYVRDLVEIGLRIEEMTAESDEKKSGLNGLDAIKKMLESDLKATQEILYMTRYIIVNLPNGNAQKHDEIRSEARVRAKAFVEGMLV